jgi:hypothetical protein
MQERGIIQHCGSNTTRTGQTARAALCIVQKIIKVGHTERP